MRFAVIVASWNSMRWLPGALASVAAQVGVDYDVCVVDDASPDREQPAFIEHFCRSQGWSYLLKQEHGGALRSQYDAFCLLDPAPEDVVVFVDGDDRLAHPGALQVVASYYRDDVLLTYGSYLPEPADSDVAMARPFPDDVVRSNGYRAFTAAEPVSDYYNHLRTLRAGLFARLDPVRDFQFPDGRWFPVCCDMAVMIPALEMAGHRHRFIAEVLYVYTRDNPLSDCHRNVHLVDQARRYILGLPPRQPLP